MPEQESKSPLTAILDVRRHERPLAAAMFAYFFLVITTFWVLKPIKKSLFIRFYDQDGFAILGTVMKGSQAELIAKVLNMFVAYAAVVAFSWLSTRWRRQHLTNVFCGFFVAMLAVYAFAVATLDPWTVWTFYLFGDLYSTLMVATFFAFLNDSVSSQAARRLYGPIGLGGVAGGAFGTMALRLWIGDLTPSAWLGVCIGITVVVAILGMVAGSRVDREERSDATNTEGRDAREADSAAEDGEAGSRIGAQQTEAAGEPSSPLLDGARLVFRSRYLLAVVTIVGLYEIVSTVMDFQFTATIEHYLDGKAIGRQFATVYALTNVVALVVQLFVTSFVMSRFRLTVGLSIVPLVVIVASGGFLALPLLWIGSLLNTADNALSYSINQSSKEALYTVTTREEKYKAKAFIDMFVQRLAKALAVGVSLLITLWFTDFSTMRWLSVFTIGVAALWLVAARYAGRHFHELEAERDAG